MPPRFDRFTIKAQEAFQDAQNIAIDRNAAAGISARLEDEIDKLPRVEGVGMGQN